MPMPAVILKICDTIGFSVCHQLSERSLAIGNITMPVCSRCMGIYTGFMITTLALFILYRKKQSGFAPTYILVLSVFFIISAGADGLLSYANIYRTNNIARMITGYFSGMGLSIICYPVFAWQFYKNSRDKKILKNAWHFIILLFVAGVFFLAGILKPAFIDIVFYYLNIIAIVFSFIYSNILIILLIPYFSNKAERLFSKHLVLPLVFGTGLSFFEIYLLKLLHSFMIRKF